MHIGDRLAEFLRQDPCGGKAHRTGGNAVATLALAHDHQVVLDQPARQLQRPGRKVIDAVG
jgi:hypothetical protein